MSSQQCRPRGVIAGARKLQEDGGSRPRSGPIRGPPVLGSVAPMLALLLVALSLGLFNFAASVGIGVSGIQSRARLRVGVIFGVFETGMPILGLLAGHSLAGTLGHAAHWIGAVLLIATGGYALIQAIRRPGDAPPESASPRTGRLLVTGAALSIDNLAVPAVRSGPVRA